MTRLERWFSVLRDLDNIPLERSSFVRSVSNPATNSVSPERSRTGKRIDRDSRIRQLNDRFVGTCIGWEFFQTFDPRCSNRDVQHHSI